VDYTWRPAGDGEERSAYRIVERGWQRESFGRLVDVERPGLVLSVSRKDGAVLLVTGLIPVSRPADRVGRLIRVMILGVTDAKDEPGMRAVLSTAGLALRGELAENIPVSYGADDFDIDRAGWSGTVADAAASLDAQVAEAASSSSPSREHAGIGESWLLPDTGAYRIQVATQLTWLLRPETRKPLAGRILVLRTDILDQADIARLRPWRALSDVAGRPTAL
jgi:hypothetical protein